MHLSWVEGAKALRILCSCLPGYGHFNPLVPLARAAQRAGHEVVFATAAEFCPRVAAAGFEAHPAGLGMAAQMQEARRRFPDEHAMAPGKPRFEAFVPRMLGGVAAPARLADLIPLVDGWRPSVVLHDEAEFAAPVAASVAGAPWASHSVVLRRPRSMARLAAEILAPVAGRHGVDAGDTGGLYRYLHFDACPPALQPVDAPVIPVAHLIRNTEDLDTVAGDRLPDWVGKLPARPTVYVTLGTLFNRKRAVLRSLLEALGGRPYNVIATVGAENVTALGPQPPNVHLVDYLPLSLLVDRLDVVVTQGGTSILPALGAGVPLLVVPQAADQFHNAEACVRAGVGLRLLPEQLDPQAVARDVERLTDERFFANAARRVGGEIAAMPGPDAGLGLLERLAIERRPIFGPEAR
ncbi:MAG TPA: glycosyltransferase [Acidimicrobiales bacterium]